MRDFATPSSDSLTRDKPSARAQEARSKGSKESKIYFDKRDHQLIGIVNDVLSRDKSRRYTRNLFYPYLHPHGVKEMAESKGLRIAHAVIHLLESLEVGRVDERLGALRSLRDEVINTAGGSLPRNTARVLLQIMKELVRAHGHYQRQLQLAHDFRRATTGNPRVVRKLLREYHLLEMPEDWNQATFDDHVHDANTKGRKSSSHLIMDAWIKGIRRLRVIYYNFLEARFAVELLEAAEIMGITVRIGIEFSARFHDRYAQLIWVPRGFPDSQAFLCFLAEEPVVSFMAEGRKVSEYQRDHVLAVLRAFNQNHLAGLNQAYGLNLAPLDKDEFLGFVGAGQASLLHLAEFIHGRLLDLMRGKVALLRERYSQAQPDEQRKIEELVKDMNKLDSDAILERYLKPSRNPEIADPQIPSDAPDVPDLLKLCPCDLIDRLIHLHSAYRFTLNLSDLWSEDVLEILYDCEGAVTRLELFNLKDFAAGKTEHIAEINQLQRAINDGNVIHLKRVIRNMIKRLETSDSLADKCRIERLTSILHDIATLKSFYKGSPIKARIGSDSTGRSPKVHGMGLAIKETLPHRAQKEISGNGGARRDVIPVRVTVLKRETLIPKTGSTEFLKWLYGWARKIPVLRAISERAQKDWVVEEYATRLESRGNIVTLGGVQVEANNGLSLDAPTVEDEPIKHSWRYLNSGLKNGLKVLIGFIPAFATFYLTKDWWVLAYLGAFIWFGITGLRNVLQSVLGGGGIRRSPLLRWNDYVSWERIADSLLFTGFSVPFLDYVVKTLLLNRLFDINTSTSPLALYTFMALANGIYLSSHNAFRGLQRGAIFANFFRTVLSIPLAVGLNAAVGVILSGAGVVGVNAILNKWAAIISKTASDFVAGIIEGTADRYSNIRMRRRDYDAKLDQLFDIYAQIELLFPEAQARDLLESPEQLKRMRSAEVHDLETIIIINSLDMLYFWMYQPRARSALRAIVKNMSEEEREILVTSQFTLLQEREISLLFVNGLGGEELLQGPGVLSESLPGISGSGEADGVTPVRRFHAENSHCF